MALRDAIAAAVTYFALTSQDGDLPMRRDLVSRSSAAPATSVLVLALGAAAFGAIAIGALAIGKLAIGRVTIKRARFAALEVDELTVGKLRVLERESASPESAGVPVVASPGTVDL
jgi:hypothetical protein